MRKLKDDEILISKEPCSKYEKHLNKAFEKFFKTAIEKILKKKSPYEAIKFCFTAGYWNAMKDMVNEEELQDAASKIVEEIKEQGK
jgi:hypothetical protein